MKHKPMEFQELDRLFSYKHKTGNIRNRIDRGYKGGMAKAGAIATSRDSYGYLVVKFTKDGRRVYYKAHRLAWLLYYGVDPGNMQIDHVDGNKENNVISNLRLVDHQGNSMNQRKHKNNKSGITGVSWNKADSKWQVNISDRGEQRYLGIFEDKFEAICCRKSAERRLGYHKNHGK